MSPPAFETIMPEIMARSRRHYSHCNPELREERIQESLCAAWSLYDSAVARENYRFTPCTLALYANRAVDSGRKFAGGTICSDALDQSHVSLDVSFAKLSSRERRDLAAPLDVPAISATRRRARLGYRSGQSGTQFPRPGADSRPVAMISHSRRTPQHESHEP